MIKMKPPIVTDDDVPVIGYAHIVTDTIFVTRKAGKDKRYTTIEGDVVVDWIDSTDEMCKLFVLGKMRNPDAFKAIVSQWIETDRIVPLSVYASSIGIELEGDITTSYKSLIQLDANIKFRTDVCIDANGEYHKVKRKRKSQSTLGTKTTCAKFFSFS